MLIIFIEEQEKKDKSIMTNNLSYLYDNIN